MRSKSYTIVKGTKFSKTLFLKDKNKVGIDLTGYAARIDIRDNLYSSVVLSLSEGAGITLGNDGKIEILISDTDTELLSRGVKIFDFELIEPGGQTVLLFNGTIGVI